MFTQKDTTKYNLAKMQFETIDVVSSCYNDKG